MTCKTNGATGIDACTAAMLANYSSTIGREIASITDAIMKGIKSADACSGNCITIKNGTPMTYNGVIESVEVISGGENYYPVQPKAIIIGDGIDAEVSLTIEGGVITAVDVTNAGSGYTFATLDLSDTYGSGATFTVDIVGGEVQSITVDGGGSDYSPLFPVVELDNIGNGTGAKLVAAVSLDTGAIMFVDVEDGGHGYSLDTNGYIVASEFSNGTNAEIKINVSGCKDNIIDSSIYYNYIIGQSNECGASSHINQIKAHFRSLGYTIRAMVNPDTNTTIMWEVCWC